MSPHSIIKKLSRSMLISILAILSYTSITHGAQAELHPVDVTEWIVPWEQTRPRDPYVDQHNRVWFVGQTGDYIAVLDFEGGMFEQYPLDSDTGPHNLIVDEQGFSGMPATVQLTLANLIP
jgi:virginiamycin B lyase